MDSFPWTLPFLPPHLVSPSPLLLHSSMVQLSESTLVVVIQTCWELQTAWAIKDPTLSGTEILKSILMQVSWNKIWHQIFKNLYNKVCLVASTNNNLKVNQVDQHMASVQNRDQLAMQPRNKCFLMKIDKHLEHLNTRAVLELVLGIYLQSSYFEYKSVVVKNLPINIILMSHMRCVVHKSDFFLSKSHEILIELFLSVKS